MGDEAAFEQAILASPDDDTLYFVFADWLDEQDDIRGNMIRAWFVLRSASRRFAVALGRGAADDDFEEFGNAAYSYQQLAEAVDRGWLWKLGAARPWVGRDLGLLVMRHAAWEGGHDWRAIAEERTTEVERAWMFCYDGPDSPWREVGQDYPSWYLVHKFLGAVGYVGSRGPWSALRILEERP
ncbi:MAG: hypothetical protein JWO38_4819 [Gemmataceae bacterium]|nr:hypothetical protein [Gemmataceae bacterium]